MPMINFFKKNWKGVVGGSLVGGTFAYSDSLGLGVEKCVENLNINNFLCTFNATNQTYGLLAGLISAPKYFFINLLGATGMGEVIVLPFLVITGAIIGALIQEKMR